MMLKSQKVPLPQVARARAGRPSSCKPEFVNLARTMTRLGATDADLAEAFDVSVVTIDSWKIRYPEFLGPLKAGKEEADKRVEHSLYQRAVGYSFNSEKIFCNKRRRDDEAREKAVAEIVDRADQRAANVIPIVRQIQRSGATSLRQIAEALNPPEISARLGGQWHATSVRNLIARA
jgi:hypothetical protein